jgi:DNA polymerase (family X)
MTERLLRALANPFVTMLGHPTNRLLLGRDSSPMEIGQVFEAALENGVILELNANPARLDLDWRYLKKVRDLGIAVAINPDAHEVNGFSDTAFGVAIARKGWLEKKDIFNTLSRTEMEVYLLNRRNSN